MSRKIDRVNDLTILTGDGGKVLVGEGVREKCGSLRKKCGSLREKCGSLRENGGQNWDLRLGKGSDQLWVQ